MRKLVPVLVAAMLVSGIVYASAAQGASAKPTTTTAAPTTTTQPPAAPFARTVTDEMAVTANQGAAAARSLSCANNETAFSPVAVQYDTTGQNMQGFAIEWVAQPDFGTGQVTGTAGPRGYFIQAEAGPADGIIRFHVTCVAGVNR